MNIETPEYFDCNGALITEGSTLIDGNGYEEKVLLCGNEEDGYDLGINATNFASPAVQQGLSAWACYPLSSIDLSDLYIKTT